MFNKKDKETMITLFNCLLQNQKDTNLQLKSLNEKLEGGIGKIKLDSNATLSSTIDTIQCDMDKLTTNVYTKEETVDTINKEYTYRKEYERIFKEDSTLLAFIETYCKYDNKYEVIELFDKIKYDFNIKRVK